MRGERQRHLVKTNIYIWMMIDFFGPLVVFGGMVQRSAAKQQNDNNDYEKEADRASANVERPGQNRRE
jgi:hypothetical protein